MSNSQERDTVSTYRTKDLNSATWPDFEKLFGKYGGVQAGCWCMFYQRAHPITDLSFRKRTERNHMDKKKLVREGKAHGILVYSRDQPVGWCQFGLKEELPRIDSGRNYRKLELEDGKLWRITCFFVDKEFRRSGIAKIALRAALDSIRRRGGGIVEAYPATHMRTVAVWFGNVTMFEREGFRKLATLGRSNLVMRKEL